MAMPLGTKHSRLGLVAKNLMLQLCWWRRKMEKPVCHISKYDNQRAHQKDPFSDGVYQYPEMLGPVGTAPGLTSPC